MVWWEAIEHLVSGRLVGEKEKGLEREMRVLRDKEGEDEMEWDESGVDRATNSIF